MTRPTDTITQLVRELAEGRGVSERTAWRWVARARAKGALPPAPIRCEYCSHPLCLGVTIRRRFCSDRCRIYSHRGRPPIGLDKLKPPKRAPLSEKGYRLSEERLRNTLIRATEEDWPELRELMGPGWEPPSAEVLAKARARARRKVNSRLSGGRTRRSRG
jgi:hypothetical protein